MKVVVDDGAPRVIWLLRDLTVFTILNAHEPFPFQILFLFNTSQEFR